MLEYRDSEGGNYRQEGEGRQKRGEEEKQESGPYFVLSTSHVYSLHSHNSSMR